MHSVRVLADLVPCGPPPSLRCVTVVSGPISGLYFLRSRSAMWSMSTVRSRVRYRWRNHTHGGGSSFFSLLGKRQALTGKIKEENMRRSCHHVAHCVVTWLRGIPVV